MRNMYIDNILPVSQSYQEPPGVSWNYCACPITRLIYPGSPKVKLILWLTHFALVNQLDHFYFLLYLYCYFCIQLYLHCCTNKWYTHMASLCKYDLADNNVHAGLLWIVNSTGSVLVEVTQCYLKPCTGADLSYDTIWELRGYITT